MLQCENHNFYYFVFFACSRGPTASAQDLPCPGHMTATKVLNQTYSHKTTDQPTNKSPSGKGEKKVRVESIDEWGLAARPHRDASTPEKKISNKD